MSIGNGEPCHDARVPETASVDRSAGRRYVQLVLVLGALGTIGPFTIDTYLPALPELSRELGATDAQAQATLSGLLLGLGLGQLLIGPLSDAIGRRKPLLAGLVLHALMSVLCALAPSIQLLIAARFLQGLAGAAVAVISMAMVRDLFTGVRAAQLFSRLMLVLGVGPIVAPSLGSALLTVMSWRGIFVVLATAALLMLALAFFALPETLPTQRRRRMSVVGSLRTYGMLFSDRLFLVLVLMSGLVFATTFAYIAGSSFILQDLYGLSPQQFGLAFTVNSIGLIAVTQLNPSLVKRHNPVSVLIAGLLLSAAAAITLLVLMVLEVGGWAVFLAPLFVIISSAGLTLPNAPAIALTRYGDAAGTAAALLGASQYVIGGAIAPLVGVLANGTPVPLAGVLVATTTLATLLLLPARRALARVDYR